MMTSRRTLRLTCAASLMVALVASMYGWQVRGAHHDATVALRAARIALQRAETRRSQLSDPAGRLGSLDLPRESFELVLIESMTTLALSAGVSELQYRRIGEPPGDIAGPESLDDLELPLRIALSFRSDHGVAFLRTMRMLSMLTGQRPSQVNGCRLLRAPRSLAVSCAIDWLWWDTA